MAHRDKLARLFRGHDARNARARENIALRRAVLADHAQRLRLHRNDRLCAGRAPRHRLLSYVHHARRTRFVQMSQFHAFASVAFA